MNKWISEACAKDIWLKLAAIMTIIGFLVTGYWLFVDDPVMVTPISARIVQDGPFHPGDSITVERTFCSRIETGAAYRYLVGDVNGRTDVYHLPDTDIYQPRACPSTLRRWLTIPKEASPGHYLEHVIMVYPINPLRNGRTELPDIAFDVVKADH